MSEARGAKVARIYPTVGAAVADPTSSLARFMRQAEQRRPKNEAAIAAYMAQGLTREQAWKRALFGS